jgi:hypothetical protein
MLAELPNRDRGKAALGLYCNRILIRNAVAYAGMVHRWDHDDNETVHAFGSIEAFAAALRGVALPITRTKRLRASRGIIVDHADPAEAAVGLSWTRDRDLACWYATRRGRDAHPFVFETLIEPSDIVTFWNGRGEREIIADPLTFAFGPIWVEGKQTYLDELSPDSGHWMKPLPDSVSWRKNTSGARMRTQQESWLQVGADPSGPHSITTSRR